MAAGETASVSAPEIEKDQNQERRRQPRYNVILLDDDDHTYDYVIRMLGQIFSIAVERAFELACEVDRGKRVIVMTTTREHAELKQEQIHAYGRDPLIPHCKGSMTSVIEPACDA